MSTQPDARRPVAIPLGMRWGIALSIGAALISGVAIYLNAFAVKQLPDAAVYTTLKNGVAAAILLAAAVVLGALGELRRIPRGQWARILAVGIVGGSIPFILFFTGLAQASAPSAAFIQKTLFVWVALLAVPFLGERLSWTPLIALAVLVAGQVLVLPPAGIVWGSGETMILLATLLWAIETVLVKKLLVSIPAALIATLRLGVGLVVLVGYLIVTDKIAVLGSLSQAQLGWVALTGVILAGYVATWFSALQRAPATTVTSVLVVGAVVTGVLTAVTKGTAPSASVVVGYLLITGATGALALSARRVHPGAARSLRLASAPARPQTDRARAAR